MIEAEYMGTEVWLTSVNAAVHLLQSNDSLEQYQCDRCLSLHMTR